MTNTLTIDKPRYAPIKYFLYRYKIYYGCILFLIVLSSFLESFGVLAFFPLFASLLDSPVEQPSGFLGYSMELTKILPVESKTVAAAIILVVVFLSKIIVILIRDIVIAIAGAKILYDVKQQVMDQFEQAHYQFLLDSQQGSLMYSLLGATSSINSLLLSGSHMVMTLLKTVFVMIILTSIFPAAAMICIGGGLMFYLAIHLISKKISYRLGRYKAVASENATVIANEFFTGFRHMVVFNTIRTWVNKFDQENRKFSYYTAKEQIWIAIPRPVMELLALCLMLGLILMLKWTNPGNFAQGLATLGVFAVALVQLLPALTSFATTRMAMMSALPNVDLVYETLNGRVPISPEGDETLLAFEDNLSFEKVTFAYKDREPLFTDLDLIFKKGEVTALVGASGGGKTTIANLILGLFQSTKGHIKVDGRPLSQISRASWLGLIGFVGQDPFTIHASFRENILFGREDRPNEMIVEAAKIANAHGFISELPDAYDTLIGDRGMTISGGQQQRLSIARAILDGPDILIFDEATSSLDTISEQIVQDAITKASENRTVIIIAHRLSTIRHADNIIVMRDGEVIEQGNHQQLISNNGDYAEMLAASQI